MYALDTSVISTLHKNFYRRTFKSLWEAFDAMVAAGQFTSTREVLRELEDSAVGTDHDWAKANQGLFVTPDTAEGAFIAGIFAVPHFQANFSQQKLIKGGKNADPFLIARAAVTGATVLTMEQFKPNAAKIPNICDHFGVPCVDLEQFMVDEGWVF